MRLALLGQNIGYSRSKLIHAHISGTLGHSDTYDIIDAELNQNTVDALKTYDGFNVTKPYKEEIKRYLDGVHTEYGVNTVKNIDGKLYGHCTDGQGFLLDFKESSPVLCGTALILGAGGAASSVAAALAKTGFKNFIHNRTAEKANALCPRYGNIYNGESVDVIVNCTSLGFGSGENPLDMVGHKDIRFAYDLIYKDTAFINHFKTRGVAAQNGMGMLIYQAIFAQEIFKNIKIENKRELKQEILQKGGLE